ncbi:Uu.00g080150.m01.CDS01 [Anthostomella pinea]|uniref:Uu.00g080150.m01.CDS01 n=1 Tax=Anthostomella pinea TaxID=933095 RepID=A0AAI8VKY9_9PEZI|nr:Uu.00g080150.m01.CDS01 [Anthostomella pinea]
MEQSATPDIPSTVPPQPPRPSPSSYRKPSPSHLVSSEPGPSNNTPDDLTSSVPSLRFPRPLGNRQLTNWISSSSPDIMQPGNFPDEDPSLTELGYDIIGTDGESQAESTTSSLDYQRPDDVQSLTGTDNGTDVDTNEADTDSSDDDETTLDYPATPNDTVVKPNVASQDEDADVETLLNQSLEHPTSFSQHSISTYEPLTYAEQFHAEELLAAMREFHAPVPHTTSPEGTQGKRSSSSKPEREDTATYGATYETYKLVCRHIREKSHILMVLSGLAVLYSLAMAGKYVLFSSSVPRELSTVPVASVSSAFTPSSVAVMTPSSSGALSTSSTTQILEALQTGSSSKALIVSSPTGQPTVCSVEMYDRSEIIVKIPQNVKSAWLAKDAILIAVSRGVQDIPTKVSSVDEGFLIGVPLEEAHGVLAVSIATTRKPRINETFRINFGNHMLTGALDAGKQLVKGFAQKVVDTVNETTAWVEETYIPAFDVMSKQVCDQTASVSDSVLQGLRNAGNRALAIPTRLTSEIATKIKQSLDRDMMARRADQAQSELARQAQDVRDELAMALLRGQLSSKLLWLKLQGKTEEYQHYLDKAEVYWDEQRAGAVLARRERAERVKTQIRARRKQELHDARASFWRKGRARA